MGRSGSPLKGRPAIGRAAALTHTGESLPRLFFLAANVWCVPLRRCVTPRAGYYRTSSSQPPALLVPTRAVGRDGALQSRPPPRGGSGAEGRGRRGRRERSSPLPRGGIFSALSPHSARTKILGVKRRLGGAAGSEARGQLGGGAVCPPPATAPLRRPARSCHRGPRRGGLHARIRSRWTRLPPRRAIVLPAPACAPSGFRRVEEGTRERRVR